MPSAQSAAAIHPETLDAVRRALAEDIGSGDVTSEACVDSEARGNGQFRAREAMVLAGTGLLQLLYDERGGVEELQLLHRDGEHLSEGETIAIVRGRARTLLECERVALNFLQRLSGIATLAREFALTVEGTNCRVLDTRETTPGLRRLEKAAAAAGGIVNHRMGLFDAVLIKHNHIAAAGGVTEAVVKSQPTGLPMEIEVRTIEELNEALSAGAKHILLDNLSPQQAREMVRLVNGRAVVEISGGINLDNVRSYAETGADFVSAGAITHSARAVDISFRLELL